MVDKEAAKYSKRSGVRRAVFVNGKEALVNQSPSKIILTTIDNSTTVWLDFLDDYGDSVFADEWFIDPDEAMKSLKREFGSFQNEWVVCDNVL